MRAALLYGPNDVRVGEVPDAVAGPGEILIKVAHNGICGSDLHMIHGMLGGLERPLPLGHEFAGVVEKLGDDVTEFSIGDSVCVKPNYSCGHCSRCAAGLTHLCQTVSFIGTGTAQGGLSEHVSVPTGMAFALTDGVSLELGALVEPMAVSYHAVQLSPVEPGEHALVLGAGPIGIGTFLALRAIGVEDVVVAELSPVRRKVIEDLGGDVLDPSEVDVAAEVMRRTGGVGVSVAFECAGAAPAFDTAVASTAARGTVNVVAVHMNPVSLLLMQVMMAERRVLASLAYQASDFDAIIGLMAAGEYPTTGWVEHIPLDAIVEEGIRPLEAGKKMKVLVDL